MNPIEIVAWAALTKEARPLAQPLVDVAARLLWRLLGRPASAAADRLAAMLAPPTPTEPSVADAVALWKSGNVVGVLAKATEIFEREGVAPIELPREFLVPTLEAAAYAADDDVRVFFAQLLVSGTREARHRHPMIVNILRELAGEDAREFVAACARADEFGIPFGPASHRPFWAEEFSEDVHVRLDVLRLIERYSEPPTTTPDEGSRAPDQRPERAIVPSEFGWRFRLAVCPPRAQ